ncbi:cation-translocating P-type ATPase [Patescibacteria group bacterium]
MIAEQQQKSWHSFSTKDVLKEVDSSPRGLSSGEATLRLEKYGNNTFSYKEKFRLLKLFLRQIKSPLVFILIIAGLVTLFFKAYTDSVVILIAVTINTAIGIFQEGKASKSFDKLRDSQKKYATVVREGKKQVILAENVVPGDILVVSAGDQISADARIIDGKGLEINEAALTGEWMSDSKNNRKIKSETSLADRSNMLYMGTLVTAGWGMAVVVSTGFYTELGKIAELISKEKAPLTNFQQNIKKLAHTLSFIVLGALVLIFIEGILRGEEVSQMIFTAVAIAVAAIPEGLPVAVSVVLAIGMERVLSRGGLVKKLNAAETLGSIDVILTDKTGTLTQAIMRVSDIVTLNSAMIANKKKEDLDADYLKKNDDKRKVLEMAILSSGGFVENPEDNLADWIVRGRPIEQAIILAGMESGLYQHKCLKERPRLDFLEFESERRYSASLHNLNKSKKRFYLAGAPEFLLALSTKIYKNGKEIKLTTEHKELLGSVLLKQASFGARIIAVAYKDSNVDEFPRDDGNEEYKDFVFGGFVLFHDPLRPDAVSSLRKAELAGIRTVMMTGDHKGTARKIGEETGILKSRERIITGEMLEELTEKDLKRTIEHTSIFARVLPKQKLRVVKAWQDCGKNVAMTGDGINDAPALRRADIGIAVNSGTEVSKEASNLILLNNSFSVIISAIEEGRKILVNLRKILVYLLSTGFSEIILIGSSLAIGLPLPVLPAQILWTNLIEEGFMNFAFAFEPKEKGIMRAKPDSFSSKNLFTNEGKILIIVLTMLTSLFLLSVFLISHLLLKNPIEYTRTIVFAALSIDSIFFAFSLKNFRKPIWKINIFSNPYLIVAVFISFLFLAGALFIPSLRFLLSLEKLGAASLLVVSFIGLFNLGVIETVKHFLFSRKKENKI